MTSLINSGILIDGKMFTNVTGIEIEDRDEEFVLIHVTYIYKQETLINTITNPKIVKFIYQ